MTCRAPGSECRIYVDGIPELAVGDYLRTRGGSCYHVIDMRPNRNRPYRRHLLCIRCTPDQIAEDAKVHQLVWYARTGSARTLRQAADLRRRHAND